jgi:hypothetical protein
LRRLRRRRYIPPLRDQGQFRLRLRRRDATLGEVRRLLNAVSVPAIAGGLPERLRRSSMVVLTRGGPRPAKADRGLPRAASLPRRWRGSKGRKPKTTCRPERVLPDTAILDSQHQIVTSLWDAEDYDQFLNTGSECGAFKKPRSSPRTVWKDRQAVLGHA